MQLEGARTVSPSRFALAVAVLCLLIWPAAGLAQNVTVGEGKTLTIKGFVIASLFAQNQNFAFGNGQSSEFPLPPETTTDEWFLDGDVRNSRLTLAFNAPEFEGDFKLGAVLEVDFFGGFTSAGAFSDEQPALRLRLAYVDIIRGKTTYRIGQAWSPLFGNVPVSPTHVAFPLGYGSAGMVGWRFPGLFIYHKLGDPDAKVAKKLTFGLFTGSWSGPGDNLGSGSAGEASALPQVEVRFDFSGKTGGKGTWGAYLVGHWDRKDLSGAGVDAPDDSLDGTAFEFGAKYGTGKFSIHGNAYTGTAIGQQFGQLTQFGDISSWGAWIQPGFQFSKRWSGHLFYGVGDADKEDVLAAGSSRIENQMIVASTQYKVGPFVFGIEWLHDTLTSAFEIEEEEVVVGIDSFDTKGDQISVSVWYKF